MSKIKVKDLVKDVYKNIENDDFKGAGEKLKTIVNGKIRNKIDAAKIEMFPVAHQKTTKEPETGE